MVFEKYTDTIPSLARMWDVVVLRIKYLVMYFISTKLCQFANNLLQASSILHGYETLHVFQNEEPWSLLVDVVVDADDLDVVEQHVPASSARGRADRRRKIAKSNGQTIGVDLENEQVPFGITG